jgi:hypothetical protein
LYRIHFSTAHRTPLLPVVRDCAKYPTSANRRRRISFQPTLHIPKAHILFQTTTCVRLYQNQENICAASLAMIAVIAATNASMTSSRNGDDITATAI